MDAAALDAARISLAPGGDVILPLAMAVIMLSVALTLKLESFAFLKTAPLRFLGAASVQIIGLPLLTLIVIHAITPPASIALGMIVVACCPGGNVSNFYTLMARGDAALSVALTSVSSLSAALLTPVSIVIWTSLYAPSAALVDEINLSALTFIVSMTLILALPLAAGMVFARYFPKSARAVRPWLVWSAIAALVLMAGGGVASNGDLILGAGLTVVAIAIGHNALALMLGAVSGRLLGFDARGRRALTFEVGIQNAGLGLVILLGQFQGIGGAAAITGAWAVWHLVSGGVLAGWFRFLDRRQRARTGALGNAQ